jgi:hypothetical protein
MDHKKMKAKTSHIERVRQENASIKTQVLNLLGWSELAFAEFQEAAGFAYLKAQFGDIQLAADLPSHKAFWSWWLMHWVRRDREFLELSGLLFRHELEGYYREIHDPLSVPFRPHAAVMEDTYSDMMHRLIKEVTR